jgi:hypothetical protein
LVKEPGEIPQQAQKWYNVIVENSKQHQLLLCVLPLITRWMRV